MGALPVGERPNKAIERTAQRLREDETIGRETVSSVTVPHVPPLIATLCVLCSIGVSEVSYGRVGKLVDTRPVFSTK